MATRFYFPLDTVADVNPAPGAWNYITEAVFRYLAKTKGSSAITAGTVIGPLSGAAGQKGLDRVYVSDPLTAQTISGTVKMQLLAREWAATDNIDQLILLIKVVSGNGGTLRGTLLALGNYGPTLEFKSNGYRNKTGADGDTLSSVVCQEHDRIVVEIGYCNSTAGTTPEASAKYGENATDLLENETDTADGAGWIEFSGNIAFSTDPNLDKQVAASADDGRRYTGTYGFSITDGSPIIGYFASNAGRLHCHIFARWTGVTIEGTIDANSYIQSYANAAGALTPELKVYGVDEDNPLAPTTAGEFDVDPLTTAAVDWDGAWTNATWAQSPSLAAIFQELVNTYTISNEAVMVQVKNDHGITGSDEANYARAWDYTGNLHGPKLHIEYTVGGASYSIIAGAGSYAVAGTATDLLKDMLISAVSGNYALTGVPVGLIKDLLMGVGVGSYALSGSTVDFPVDRVIGAGSGSYSLTGATVALLKDMLISTADGEYTMVGTAVSLPIDRVISAAPGDYAIAGTAINLIKALLISAGAGSYAISGTAASLLLDWILSASPGSYTITGVDADLLKALIMAAGGGTYTLTGSDAGLLYGKIMVAGSGSYVITGTAADLLVDLVMQALGGSYTLTGQAATLTSGAIIVVGHPTGYAPFYPMPMEAGLHATPKEDALHATPKGSSLHATPRKEK